MATKTTTIQIRVTPAEKKLMQHSAKQHGLPLSAWIRLALLNSNLRTLLADSKKKIALIVCALLWTVACGGAREFTTPSPVTPTATVQTAQAVLDKWRAGQPIRVMVLGASIAQGCCADGWERLEILDNRRLSAPSAADDSVRGYVQQLRQLVRSKNAASVVTNESGDGYDAARAAHWLISQWLPTVCLHVDGVAQCDKTKPPYDMVIVAIAGNDSNRGAPLALYMQHMQSMIDAITKAGIVPVLLKESDLYDLPAKRFSTPIENYMNAIDQLAATNVLSVMDGYAPFHAAVVAGGGIDACGLFHENDGVHPNQRGHDILFRAYEQWFNGR